MDKERLIKVRKRFSKTPYRFAKKLGINAGTYSKYESGETPHMRTDNLEKIVKATGVSADYILGLSDFEEPFIESHPGEFISVPVYGSVPAGEPMEALEVDGGYVFIEKSKAKGGKKYFGLKVKGDSMYPYYMEGDIIICELTSDFHSGDDVVVFLGNEFEATLKRIHDKGDHIELEPINREYPVKKIYPNDNIRLQVLGVVKELRREI